MHESEINYGGENTALEKNGIFLKISPTSDASETLNSEGSAIYSQGQANRSINTNEDESVTAEGKSYILIRPVIILNIKFLHTERNQNKYQEENKLHLEGGALVGADISQFSNVTFTTEDEDGITTEDYVSYTENCKYNHQN